MITVNQLKMINLAPRDRKGGDCVIKAVTFICQAIYTEVEELVMKEQPAYSPFRKGTGVWTQKLLKHGRKLFGKYFLSVDIPMFHAGSMKLFRTSLRDFVATHKEGTYLVCRRGHAFVLKDGEIFDGCPINWDAEVLQAYKAVDNL